MATINVKGINFANLTDEQKKAMAEILGIDISNISEAKSAKKVSLGKLEGKLDDKGHYACACCGEDVDYNSLDETAQAKARKSGVCPKCQKIADFVNSKSTGTVRVKNAVSAGDLCRAAILPHIDQLTAEHMALLTDKENCKKQMKLAYALFVELPEGCTKDEKNRIRKPNGKDARFAAVEYTICGKKFVMTNDFYVKNVAAVESYMAKLFPSNEE